MLKVLFFVLISSGLFAQSLKDKLVGDWIKEDIRLKDGSPILSGNIKTIQLRYIFQKNGNLRVTYDGKSGDRPYIVKGDTIKIGTDTFFKIVSVSDIRLVVNEVSADSSANSLQISFLPAHLYHIGYMPEKYVTRGKDTIYVAKPNYLEPFFIEGEQSAVQYISEQFDFPEFKTGDFYTRFIITKDAEVKGIEILNSTNEKYNGKLIAAIKKTQGKWAPALWEGVPVNAEVKMGFDFGWSEKTVDKKALTTQESSQEKMEKSDEALSEAKYYFLNKNYNEAIRLYGISIDNNPLNVEAYYGRASAYAVKKDTKKMCVDLLHLKNLEQVKGTELWNKFCNK